MSNIHTSKYVHCIFSTRDTQKQITADLQPRLWAFMGGVARENGIRALAISGWDDHAHALLALPEDMTVAQAVHIVKDGSAAMVYETFPQHRGFQWQDGFGVFSVDENRLRAVVEHINQQEPYHRHKSFKEEYSALLAQHITRLDEWYYWE